VGPNLAELLPSWQLALRAERKSPATVANYTEGVRGFLKWCADRGIPPELTRTTVQAFTADLLDNGAEAATARSRHSALQRFAAWLTAEGELDANPILGVKPPKLDSKVTQALSDEQLKALLGACKGKTLLDRRDEAVVRLMAETGARAGEILSMSLTDVDLTQGLATVRRGKAESVELSPLDHRLPPPSTDTSGLGVRADSRPRDRCGWAGEGRRSAITASTSR
jgi:site-specific recombinase XerC